MKSLLASFKKFGWVWLLGSVFGLAFIFNKTGCYQNKQGNRGEAERATSSEKPTAKGDEIIRESIGPVTQQDFNQVLDAGEYTRISVDAAMPNDAGTGTYSIGIRYIDDPNASGGPTLEDEVDRIHLDYHPVMHYISYSDPPIPTQQVIAFFNLMREKNFFNLNVTRDPEGGPDKYGIGVSICRYGETHEDCKDIVVGTNVRDTSTPDNAAFFEVIDFIRNNFIPWALNNYWCRVEYLNEELISQYGSECPTLP